MMSTLQTSALCLTASLWMMVSVMPIVLVYSFFPCYCICSIFNKVIISFMSQMMTLFPRGSGPDQFSILPDHTTQTLWTSTTTKTDESLQMTSIQTAGKQLPLVPMTDIFLCLISVSQLFSWKLEAWSLYRPVDWIQSCIPASHLLPASLASPTISHLSAQCTSFKNRWKRTCHCL